MVSNMKILSISSDRKVFEEGSAMRARTREYGRLVDEMHIIVCAKNSHQHKDTVLPPNIFLYPTNTRTRFGHIFSAIIHARALARRGVRFDVVTAQDPFELGVTAFLIARMIGAKLHLQIHTDFMSPYFIKESLINRIRSMIAKLLVRRADALRVVSERIKNSLQGVDGPVRVLPIFIDVEHITQSLVVKNLKSIYPQFEKHILMASRLSPEKNIELAILSMSEVVKKSPTTGLIIVGSGDQEKALREKVRTLTIQSNVVFEGWQNDLISYYKTADIFLLTSNYEGYGMTIVEALAAGCPVVATDVGCVGEIMHHGVHGLVVPVGDKDAIVRAILDVLSGKVTLTSSILKTSSKEDYLAQYLASWQDTLRDFPKYKN